MVLAALEAETGALITAVAGLTPAEWELPTRCTPWPVRDLVGHVITALSRVPAMVAAPTPERADTTATAYYRPDHRFSDAANADRVDTAHGRAATSGGLTADLKAAAQAALAAARHESPDRLVRTRHDDAMLLSDFLTTRVVEVAVHGLDVADALNRPAWLTTPAAEHLQELLFGPQWRHAVAGLGWDPVTLLRRTTGRAPVSDAEAAALARAGLRPLTLG
ncbi:maleylpyruvate isomerase N-terminal domain-containing protein [Paractinoplanes globisporus]|uniref:Maleylpyruvate isomerase N-terminal domain-containing protein n=1 Tax=Paractinoplanes globisporus TaxID=113565 RepID=A0ABW6WQ54_9ACTN|nr:maleylpyruvate isomerase N-terminal domain-containing protein [Actinoplanes globisporus]